MIPPSPKAVPDAASSSASIVITTSPLQAPARLAASRAPSLMSETLFPGLRLNMLTSCPAFTRLAAIDVPMCPSPINPSFISPSPGRLGLGSLRGRHELWADGIDHRRVHD